jgi:hypothetical protein
MLLLSLTDTPIDLTVYDSRRVTVLPEHNAAVVTRSNVAYKGNLFVFTDQESITLNGHETDVLQ